MGNKNLKNEEELDGYGSYAMGYQDRSSHPTKGISSQQKDKLKVLKSKVK